jgi:hypothetical protein
MSTSRCKHCGKKIKKNPRLKVQQHYCGSKECQQARKNKWEREKIGTDEDYRAKRKSSLRPWYNEKPCGVYQREYRESHPEYVKICREKQKERNQKRTHSPRESQIVNPDALAAESLITQGIYTIIPFGTDASEKIVNPDAFLVQISHVQHIAKNNLQIGT